MKLSELQKEVNKDLDDSLSNADITGWLNRALDDLSSVAKYQKDTTISLVVDQKKYALPADLIEIVYLFDVTTELDQLGIADMNSTGYKKWGSNVIIQPTPTEVKTIDLYYYAKLPSLVNPDDVPVIREDFHDLLVLFAVAKARYQDESVGEDRFLYDSVWQEYLVKKQEFASEQYGEIHTIKVV